MKVLVTGGAGFIGSHLVEALIRKGALVRVLDNLTTGKKSNLKGVEGRIEFLRGDIRDEKVIRKALRGIDVVFHQAALRSVPKSFEDPVGYHEVNASATLRLLKAASEAGARRFIYASSSSVYGRNPLPQKETMVPQPLSPYAASKLCGEVYCTTYARLMGLETVVLRYFNVFGPRQSLESQYAVVIPKFIASLLQGEPPPVHGSGRQTRDFTYIDNVVHANLKAASSWGVSGEIFNVACGKGHSIIELAQVLGRMVGVKATPSFRSARTGDIPHSRADISKTQRLLGYQVKVPFLKGLATTTEWFKKHPQLWKI